MKTLAALIAALALAIPAVAADSPDGAPPRPRRSAPAKPHHRVAADDAPKISLRPYFLVTGQEFSAQRTFDATFGSSFQPFWGAGLELAFRQGPFVDVSASRFHKDGQRAFYDNGQTFGLGIPLTTTITPFEVTAGYRFLRIWRRAVPYLGAGFGSYGYTETGAFADPSLNENVDTRHAGYLVVGGAEFRVHTWIALSVDAQYTHISGILGNAGLSQQTGESNLGGTAARFRVLVGR